MSTPTQAPPPDDWKPTAPALRDPPENVYAVLVWYTDETNYPFEHTRYDATLPDFERAGREIGAILTIFPERVAHIRLRDEGKDARP
jgi:hypothetical protein